MYLSLSLYLSLYLSMSLSFCWSGHVSSSLWSNVRRVTTLSECSLVVFLTMVSQSLTYLLSDKVTYRAVWGQLKITLYRMVTRGFMFNGHVDEMFWLWRLEVLFFKLKQIKVDLLHCVPLISGIWIRIFSYTRAPGVEEVKTIQSEFIQCHR